MKKLGNAILMIDIPFNVVGIILCVWRINIMLHSNLQRLIDEEGHDLILDRISLEISQVKNILQFHFLTYAGYDALSVDV